MRKMKILFIIPYVPNLIRVRSFNLICALKSLGHDITLATLTSGLEDEADIHRLEEMSVEVFAEPLYRWRSLVNCLKALPGNMPLQAVYCWQPELAHRIERLLMEDRFDVVHVEHLRGARYGLIALKMKQAPVVWDSVDSITHLFRQAVQQTRKITTRAITQFELNRTPVYEGRLVEQFDHTLVTSPVDQQAFLELTPTTLTHVEVVPNGVDLEYFHPDSAVTREMATLVISGKMSYHANVTMVLHLVRDIMPLVWVRQPDVKLNIVGKDPPRELLALSENHNIVVTGRVPDLVPYLQSATAAVAPITYGAGIQNKVLEALACATPVIASAQAISALQVRPGEELLVAEEPALFAEKTLELLADLQLQQRLGIAGRKYVEQHHSWSAVAGQLVRSYQQVIESFHPIM